MRNWMPKVGSMGLDMMLRTCTIQVNLDYSSEKDMVKKFRTAITLQPVITALFSNSPFYEGEASDFLSLRTEVWRNTDKARCGIPRCVFDHDFGYEKWVDYLLSVPMYFIYRNSQYNDVAGSSFKNFLEGKLRGYEGIKPTMKDWEDHMSVAFTDVRLKGTLKCEVLMAALGTEYAHCQLCGLVYYMMKMLWMKLKKLQSKYLMKK